MTIPYTRVEQDGAEGSITFFAGGAMHIVTGRHPNYNHIRDALIAGDGDPGELIALAEPDHAKAWASRLSVIDPDLEYDINTRRAHYRGIPVGQRASEDLTSIGESGVTAALRLIRGLADALYGDDGEDAINDPDRASLLETIYDNVRRHLAHIDDDGFVQVHLPLDPWRRWAPHRTRIGDTTPMVTVSGRPVHGDPVLWPGATIGAITAGGGNGRTPANIAFPAPRQLNRIAGSNEYLAVCRVHPADIVPEIARWGGDDLCATRATVIAVVPAKTLHPVTDDGLEFDHRAPLTGNIFRTTATPRS